MGTMFKGIFCYKNTDIGFKNIGYRLNTEYLVDYLTNFQLSVVDKILHFLLVFRLQRHFVLYCI